jgi:hypothetical protein
MNSNELTQMLLDAGFPYTMDTLHNMDKFQKLLEMEREQCAKLCEQPIDEIQITDDCSELVYMDSKECASAIRARGSND